MGVADVLARFLMTSAIMWAAPLIVLYIFNSDLIPAFASLSPPTKTLVSGGVAVLLLNITIGVYIWLALRDPLAPEGPQPDPEFLAAAKASVAGKRSTSDSRETKPDPSQVDDGDGAKED